MDRPGRAGQRGLGRALLLSAALGACAGRGLVPQQPAALGPPEPPASGAPEVTLPPPSAQMIASSSPPPAPPPPLAGSCLRKSPGTGASRLGGRVSGATLALAELNAEAGGRRVLAYVADGDEPSLHTVDVGERRVLSVTALEGTPEQVLVLGDGRVAVTLRERGAVEVLEPGADPAVPLERRCLAELPGEPWAMATTPDDRELLVTLGAAGALAVLEAGSFSVRARVSLPREPRGVVVTHDGAKAFVAHRKGALVSVVDVADPRRPRRVELRLRPLAVASRALGAERRGGAGDALVLSPPEAAAKAGEAHAPRRSRLFAPFASSDGGSRGGADVYGEPGAPLLPAFGSVAVVDPEAERALGRAALVLGRGASHEEQSSRCLSPRGAVLRADALFVACRGTAQILELDARANDPSQAQRRSVRVPAGPSGLALDEAGGRLVVWSQDARALSILPLEGDAHPPLTVPPRGGTGAATLASRGRLLFQRGADPAISADGRSCESCHPEGRDDGLTWQTPEGPRQTPWLAGRLAGRGHFGWAGAAASLEDQIRGEVKRLGGRGLLAADVEALASYLRALPDPPRPPSGAAPEQVARGRALFEGAEAGCAGCHPGGGSDERAHDVGTTTRGDSRRAYLTPSLRQVGTTAPYLHDGRYPGLLELLEATDLTMGHTIQLTREDRRALVAYLETL